MKLSLSTNWCNRRIESGEKIAEAALELGFGEIELGFHTTFEQVAGIKRYLDKLPVGSVHAFCPVPISAPYGYPELYQLASLDSEARKMAQLQITKNLEFASDIGANTVVLHAGRVMCETFIPFVKKTHLRDKRSERMVEICKAELFALLPALEKYKVTLALENLPYIEGFPNEKELSALLANDFGGYVKGWFDTGHNRVRELRGWITPNYIPADASQFAGMHLNDAINDDDHLPPGEGKVDFAALKTFASSLGHVVFEPGANVDEARLKAGIEHIRKVWQI